MKGTEHTAREDVLREHRPDGVEHEIPDWVNRARQTDSPILAELILKDRPDCQDQEDKS